MTRVLTRTAILLAVLGISPMVRGRTVRGTVNNVTTGKPGAGAEVVLIQLQGGMAPVANGKTDASGQFSFDHPDIGARCASLRGSESPLRDATSGKTTLLRVATLLVRPGRRTVSYSGGAKEAVPRPG